MGRISPGGMTILAIRRGFSLPHIQNDIQSNIAPYYLRYIARIITRNTITHL